MDAALAAYRKLVWLAAADGEIGDGERELLERYRRVLGIPRSTAEAEARRWERRESHPEPVEGGVDERVHVLRMVADVASADLRLCAREFARLEVIRGVLEVPRVQYADVVVAAERRIRHRRDVRRAWSAIAVIAIVLLGVGAAVLVRERRHATEARALELRFDELRAADAERSASLVRASWDELEASTSATLFELSETVASALLLVRVDYDLVIGRRRAHAHSAGTAFLVSPDGRAVTCKHVVQPWKFSAEVRQRIADGWRVDEESVRIVAWPEGARVLDERRRETHAEAYRSEDGKLAVERLAADAWEERGARLADGTPWRGFLHTLDEHDLALLRVAAGSSTPHVSLATDARPRRLDHVMIVGYPGGPAYLEGVRAAAAAAVGTVSKIEASIFVTAPVVHGNSGGPVVDSRGRVIGVAVRALEDAPLGAAIHVRHVAELLSGDG